MNNKRNDLITGIVLAVFALWYLWQSFSIRVFAAMGKLGRVHAALSRSAHLKIAARP